MANQPLSVACSSCNFPIEGILGPSKCPNCGISGTITQGVEVPTVIFWGGIGLVVGYLIGKSKTISSQLSKL